jgi:hypothetical protein
MISLSSKVLLKDDPDFDEGIKWMEFRLTYDGVLLGANSKSPRAEHKQEIRQHFHPQLKAFWEKHPFLKSLKTNEHLSGKENQDIGYQYGRHGIAHQPTPPWLERHADNYERAGVRFAPLVCQNMDMLCSLDILFLRPESPGSLVNGGDLDNRLKTLFDALRMSASKAELAGFSPSDDFNPFFVLLEPGYFRFGHILN